MPCVPACVGEQQQSWDVTSTASTRDGEDVVKPELPRVSALTPGIISPLKPTTPTLLSSMAKPGTEASKSEAAKVETLTEADKDSCSDASEWVEARDGWDWCTLCRKYMTDQHLSGKNHRYRAEMKKWDRLWEEEMEGGGNPELAEAWAPWIRGSWRSKSSWADDASGTEAEEPIEGPPAAWGDPSYFQWTDGWWRCLLCDKWADGAHVKGQRHLNKVWLASGEDGDAVFDECQVCAPGQREFDPWGPDWKKEEPSSEETAPSDSWRSKLAKPSAKSTSASSRPEAVQVPPPWKMLWSDDIQAHYYWNQDTDETTWDAPIIPTNSWS